MDIKDFNRKSEENIINLRNHTLNNGCVVPLLHFKRLEEIEFIEHCFTTRGGGTSRGIFESMNLSFTRGDANGCVLENYRRIAEAMGTDIFDFVTSDQTHTTNVMRVGKSQQGTGVVKSRTYTDVDGLITNEPNVVLSTFFADCVPLYFVDPVNKAIGLSHSGWRGTVNRMGLKTVLMMEKEFGTKAGDVIAAIGPSICQDCYEIGEDVAVEFIRAFGHADDPMAQSVLVDRNDGKYQLDLWACNRIVLKEAGVKPENIITTNICTCCNPGLLFSHRASRGLRGNLGAFMYIK